MAADDPTNPVDESSTTSVVGNGLKVALIAGGILGAGFLFWRLAYGNGEEKEEEKTETKAAPSTAAAVAPIATCSCGSAPAPVHATPYDADTVIRVGDRIMTLGELQREVQRRVAA